MSRIRCRILSVMNAYFLRKKLSINPPYKPENEKPQVTCVNLGDRFHTLSCIFTFSSTSSNFLFIQKWYHGHDLCIKLWQLRKSWNWDIMQQKRWKFIVVATESKSKCDRLLCKNLVLIWAIFITYSTKWWQNLPIFEKVIENVLF